MSRSEKQPELLDVLLGYTQWLPLQDFRKYLKEQHCTENLLFWEAVQSIKGLEIKSGDHKAAIKSKSLDIYDEYMGPNAKYEINISQTIRGQVKEALDSNQFGSYVFEDAQYHVYTLMRTDSYKKFLRSYDGGDSLNRNPGSRRSSISSATSVDSENGKDKSGKNKLTKQNSGSSSSRPSSVTSSPATPRKEKPPSNFQGLFAFKPQARRGSMDKEGGFDTLMDMLSSAPPPGMGPAKAS